eukprot:TRINITY_DN7531_c2_g1_i1.p1 TRINITY_DN7531_c2_g1~~TRINITY_DN7531_c2_g1_i1.p1  ORF type:complete len:291 (-),score=-22.22 TRINITY_DN7531_c2_g1_i1:185-1057(-)
MGNLICQNIPQFQRLNVSLKLQKNFTQKFSLQTNIVGTFQYFLKVFLGQKFSYTFLAFLQALFLLVLNTIFSKTSGISDLCRVTSIVIKSSCTIVKIISKNVIQLLQFQVLSRTIFSTPRNCPQKVYPNMKIVKIFGNLKTRLYQKLFEFSPKQKFTFRHLSTITNLIQFSKHLLYKLVEQLKFRYTDHFFQHCLRILVQMDQKQDQQLIQYLNKHCFNYSACIQLHICVDDISFTPGFRGFFRLLGFRFFSGFGLPIFFGFSGIFCPQIFGPKLFGVRVGFVEKMISFN